MSFRPFPTPWPFMLVITLAAFAPPVARGQVVPYNPYTDSQEPLAPVAPDGTIRWGTFFKSAALQKKYEQLWKLGACRGTNPDITVPVAANRLNVDALPESEFGGTVRVVAGTAAGGTVTFVANPGGPPDEPLMVAQFHPAGVTRCVVTGTASPAILQPGMTVRLTTTVDSRGRPASPVKDFEIIAPPGGRPVPVVADQPTVVVGTVTQVRAGLLGVRVDAGPIRKLLLPLADDAVATIDAADLALVGAGDRIDVKGRLWDGEGSVGAGTVFASEVRVRKAGPAGPVMGNTAKVEATPWRAPRSR